MPSLAITLNQAFRYFLAGAFFIGVSRWLGQPLEARLNFTGGDGLGGGAALVALSLVVGTLAYCLHRAVVYPVFHRFVIWRLFRDRVKQDPARWVPWWPLDVESELTGKRVTDKNTSEYFAGWSAEVHFLYMVVELFYFALWVWPGAETHPRGWYSGVALAVLAATWTWDLTANKAEVHHRRGGGPTTAAADGGLPQ